MIFRWLYRTWWKAAAAGFVLEFLVNRAIIGKTERPELYASVDSIVDALYMIAFSFFVVSLYHVLTTYTDRFYKVEEKQAVKLRKAKENGRQELVDVMGDYRLSLIKTLEATGSVDRNDLDFNFLSQLRSRGFKIEIKEDGIC